MSTNNIHPQDHAVTRYDRNKANRHTSFVIWLTGLSGAGKSTIARELELQLCRKNYKTYMLDGDNIRHGINKDLDFSDAGREENLRRVGEICKLLVDTGIIVVAAFISPMKKDREQLKSLLGDDFHQIYLRCPLAVCEQRDVKGLYQKARKGLIKNFTGISSAYEVPENADLTLDTSDNDIDTCVAQLSEYLETILTPKQHATKI